MKYNFLQQFGLLILVCSLMCVCGCSATKGVTVRGYVEKQKRVDQGLYGNGGYVLGEQKYNKQIKGKSTREVYVVEVSKEADSTSGENDAKIVKTSSLLTPKKTRAVFKKSKKFKRVPQSDRTFDVNEKEKVLQDESSFVAYTVEKDDTLQKISNKFYDGYSQWTRIHDANKDLIDDPDNIKPGIVIQIPMD